MRAAAIVLILAGWAAGSALAQSEPPASGEWAYRQACAECHRSPERLVRRLSGDEREDRELLDAFLAAHYAPDETTRRAIIDYLLAL